MNTFLKNKRFSSFTLSRSRNDASGSFYQLFLKISFAILCVAISSFSVAESSTKSLTSSSEVSEVKTFEAIYKAKFRGIGVTAVRKLELLPNGNHKFSFEANSWLAKLSEHSEFNWTDNTVVQPQHYVYSRTGLGRDRKAVLDFDWDTKKVVNNVNDKPWSMSIPEGVFDKLSYQLQIQSDLINNKALAPYSIADGGKIKTYEFEILGEENISTPAGDFKTVKIKRLHSNEKKRHTYFWLAPDWNYLMVKVEQKDGSQSYSIDLNSAVIDGKEVTGKR